MRSQFIDAKSVEEAWEWAPWAAVIVNVEGGFMAFESEEDHEVWSNQK